MKMKGKLRRGLAVLLAAGMILAAVPTAGFAAEPMENGAALQAEESGADPQAAEADKSTDGSLAEDESSADKKLPEADEAQAGSQADKAPGAEDEVNTAGDKTAEAPILNTSEAAQRPLGTEAAQSGLSDLLVYTGSNEMQKTALLGKANPDYPDRVLFKPEQTSYTINTTDAISMLRFALVAGEPGAKAAIRSSADAEAKELTFKDTVDESVWSNWVNCGVGKTDYTLTVTPPEGSANSKVDYEILVNSYPTLSKLSFKTDGAAVYAAPSFSAGQKSYELTVDSTAAKLSIDAAAKSKDCTITYNGGSDNTVTLAGTDSVEITVATGTGEAALSTTYTVALKKAEAASLKITAEPSGTIVKLYDANGSPLKPKKDGSYGGLLPGAAYTYTAVKYGYIMQDGAVDAAMLESGMLAISLSEAPAPAKPLPSYTGDWTSFRGNPQNMGNTDAKTPRTMEETSLKWAEKYGTGWSAAPTPPIIVNDDLYVGMSNKLLRIDKNTGKKLAESPDMSGTVGFAMNPLLYAEGMIFVPISSGQIQALRADTLEPLWVSEKIPGTSQSVSPITYHNGYIYTGSWSGEEKSGVYYALSVTDEDPTKTDEVKKCAWKLEHQGGFYWAGAYATDHYIVFGSDDGSPEREYTETAVLYSCDPITGEIIDTIEGIKGDIRSTVAYDAETDALYFSTKGGRFYKVKINEDGAFNKSSVKFLETGGMCTGTPLVYNGRAYLGVSGEAQFSPTGQRYKVIDAKKMEEIYAVEIPGYAQSSALLSTAYAKETGKVYVYVTYNYTPGGVFVLEDSQGQTEAKGSHLFLPEGALAQYCICSLVCDKDGTIYYKNDSCNLMALERNPAKSEGIAVNAGAYDGSFLLPRQSVTVKAGLAKEYGYPVAETDNSGLTINKATVADALVAMHIAKYGEDFTPETAENYLKIDKGGLVSKAFEKPATSSGFFVNGAMPGDGEIGDTADTALLAEGDTVEFFFYQDAYCLDYYTRFTEAEKSVKTGQSFTLTLEGFMALNAMFAPGEKPEAAKLSGKDGSLTILTGEAGKAPVTELAGKTFDENGQVTLSFDKAGTYVISAKGTVMDKSMIERPIIAPWCVVTVTAKSSGGGGGGGGSSTSGTTADETKKDQATTGEKVETTTKQVEAKVDSSTGKATAAVSASGGKEAVTKAAEAMKKSAAGTLSEVKFEMKLDGAKASDVKEAAQTIAASTLKEAADAKIDRVTIGTPVANLTLNLAAQKSIASQAGSSEVIFGAAKADPAASEALKSIKELKDRPVFDLSVTAGGKSISSFGGGTITVALPYELKSGENANGVCVYYVDDKGSLTAVSGASYDTKTKMVTFGTEHFSYYAVGYNAAAAFTDVKSTDWFFEAVSYLSGKGIVKGTSESTFGPDNSITRAEFVQILYNKNDAPAAAATSKFSDVKSGAWYAGAVAWAAEQGIVSGSMQKDGTVRFRPDDNISRQDMAVILSSYLSKVEKKELKAENEAAAFSDSAQIAAYAKEAAEAMQKGGIISGTKSKDGSAAFKPADNATRAEAASMLAKLFQK